MSEKFAKYLQKMRQSNELTQQQVIEYLAVYDVCFEKLDITTFSRWERGATAPKLSKQLLLARAFGDDITLLIDSSTDKDEAKAIVLDELVGPALYPYWQGEKESTTYESPLPTDDIYALAKLQAFHERYLGVDISEELLQNENLILRTTKDSNGHLLGHRLYTFVPFNTPDEQLSPSNLIHCPFVTLEKNDGAPVNMYTISGFNPLPEVRLAGLINLIDVLRENPEIKFFITNCHKQANYVLYDTHTDCEIIGKGELTNEGGVKVFGRRYKYVRLKVKVETLLATKTITKLLPYTNELADGFKSKS
ncbi:Helix-turn-helix XRE-family like proteins [Vibrio sp. B1ASS3]|uniref:helix-turn-helix transcriptional regulator n=1 Tax=Vibrio sp. B1ASS3 TaxID=2751176 RepID=UPI001ABA0982|nr:helix-turn-helix transcriptional regulator [Vibrio sp. B1ASS3]CAD7809768.1 Helix-turn-helix XRE-family like proteins [Vibrio sp. B1ASS3]CAE6910382.1 Helix-turn-helix XRE-family like proteins [Vibrio sp. B1ASS3]